MTTANSNVKQSAKVLQFPSRKAENDFGARPAKVAAKHEWAPALKLAA